MNNTTLFDNSTKIPEKEENLLIVFLDGLILFLSLCGNSLVIYTICKEKNLQTTCNYLLLNLSICDIVVVFMGTSIDILLQFTESRWVLGLLLCKVINPTLTMFYISASLILVVISVDRYKMFVHPLKARYKRKNVKFAVMIVHGISLICILPFGYFATIENGYCYDSWPKKWHRQAYTVFLFHVQYAIPLCIMAFAYFRIAVALLRNKSAFGATEAIYTTVGLDTTSTGGFLNDGKARSLSPIVDGNVCYDDKDENTKHTLAHQRKLARNNNENNGEKCLGSCCTTDGKQLINGLKHERSNTRAKNFHAAKSPRDAIKRRMSDRVQMRRANAIRRRNRSSTISGIAQREQRNKRALKMIVLVVVVFAVFMLPMQVMSLLLDFGEKVAPAKYEIYAWFVMCSYFGSCTLNPFIYGLVDRTFRAGFKKFARKYCCRKK